MLELKFRAVGRLGKDKWKYGANGYDNYDCSFLVTFDETKVTNQEVNRVVQEQQQLFKRYHPTGQIIQQTQRKF